MALVGQKLKELRCRRGLPVRELAVRSGLSHATISLIERDKMSPSIDTLGAILETLGTTFAVFFADLPAAMPYNPFYGTAELTEIGVASAISARVIGANHPHRQILMLDEIFAVGSASGPSCTHNAQEAGVVIEGAVEVTVGDQTRNLKAGEAYYFDSHHPHRFRNVANQKSRIISAVTPPSY
jgi:transcriptional regulator with XRE-family HTH domain